MQDYVLPVLATVLGPGEIAYWAVTGDAFRMMEMNMPIVLPRMSFTFVDETTSKHLQKYNMSLDDVIHRFDKFKHAWLDGQDELELDARFGEIRDRMMELYEPLLDRVAAERPGLEPLTKTNKQLLARQIDYMRTRVREDFKLRHDVSLRQLDRMLLMLWPDGKPQERVANFAPYWNKYKRDWLNRLLEVPYDCTGKHRIIYL